MGTGSRFLDEQLRGWLLASPDLDDGVEALGYWRERSRRLPWYRVRARREAVQMTVRWEQRVAAALIAQRGAPAASRMSAGLLVAQARLGRWARRARIAMAVTVMLTVAVVVVIAAAAVTLVGHAM